MKLKRLAKVLVERRLLKFWLAALIIPVAGPLHAQEASREGVQFEHKAGYSELPLFGGPNSALGQLEENDRVRKPAIRTPALDPVRESWFDWKKQLSEKYGIEFSGHYAALYTAVDESLTGEDEAFGGAYRFVGSWTLIGKGEPNNGRIATVLDHRHAYTDTTPGAFGGQVGYLGIPGGLFGDIDFAVVSLDWQQRFNDGEAMILVGRYTQDDYQNIFALSPWSSFNNLNIVLDPSMFLPEPSWGIGAGSWVGEQWYGLAGIKDANGTIDDDLELFSDGEEFSSFGEIGWSPARDQRYFKNVRATAWHIDARSDAEQPDSSYGIAAAGNWTLDNKMFPFVRAGWSEGDAPLFNRSFTAGLVYQVIKTDLIGLAVNWGDPADSSLPDQTSTELFWRIQLLDQFDIAPSVQYLVDPALNPNENEIWLFGTRLRLTY